MQLVYPLPPLKKKVFKFLPGVTVIPREIEENGYAKFFGGKKVH